MQANSIGISFGAVHSTEGRFCAGIQVLYLVRGELTATVNGRNCNLYPEDIIVLNTGDEYAFTVTRSAVLCTIRYDAEILEALGVERGTCFDCISVGGGRRPEEDERSSTLRRLVQRLIFDYLKNKSVMSASVMSDCYGLLDHLIRDFSHLEAEPADASGQRMDRRIREIAAYIQENYASQITLSDLAKKFYVSDSHLSRLFKSSLGLGFRDYLTKIRLEAAERELCTTDRSIIRLANDNGFSGLAVFNRSFKEKYGETPSVYKKMACKETAKALKQETVGGEAMPEEEAREYVERFEATMSGKSTMQLVELDADRVHPYEKPWKACLNVGAATDLLNPSVQKHILTLKEQISFHYVRFWNLFIENFIYFPQRAGNHLYFSKLDSVLDFLLSNQLKPFIQFGPKPRSVIGSYGESNQRTNLNSSEDILQLNDTGWQALLEHVFRHLVTKYGGQEMETWVFEMWSPCPWDNPWTEWYTEEKFAALYKTVKKYVPGAMVGGCEFTDTYHNDRLPRIARRWRALGVEPDFISFSALPYDLPKDAEPGTPPIWRPEPELFMDKVSSVRRSMAKAGLGEKKLFLTVWNITASNRNIINDSVYRGTYIMKTAVDALDGGVDLLAFWMGSDAYSDEADVGGMLFGGAGLLSIGDIAKPALHALTFLKKLRSKLIDKGPGYIVTRNNFGIYSVVYYNRSEIPLAAMMRPENSIGYEDLSGEDGSGEALHLRIRVQNVQSGVYNVRRQYVNRSSGSILDEWQRLGTPTMLVKEDVQYMSMKSLPDRSFSRIRARDNCMEIDIQVGANEFGVVEIEYQPGLMLGGQPL